MVSPDLYIIFLYRSIIETCISYCIGPYEDSREKQQRTTITHNLSHMSKGIQVQECLQETLRKPSGNYKGRV